MSTLSLRKIKHDGSSVDNIVTNTDGGVGIGGIDPSTLPSFVHHAIKVQNGGGLGIQSDSATDNRWIFFGNGTANGDVQRAGIVNQGSDQSLGLATAGTQRLIVDASGRVTKPYQPVASAGWSGDVTPGNVVFANIMRVNIGGHLNASGRFTAPVAGTYFVAISGMASGGADLRLQLDKNGSEFGGDYASYSRSSNYTKGGFMGYITLAANDYVEFRVSGGSYAPLHSNHGHICFHLIG
jgi:hypothetical protein